MKGNLSLEVRDSYYSMGTEREDPPIVIVVTDQMVDEEDVRVALRMSRSTAEELCATIQEALDEDRKENPLEGI